MAATNTAILRAQNEALTNENALLKATIDELAGKLRGQIKRGNILKANATGTRRTIGSITPEGDVYVVWYGDERGESYPDFQSAKAALFPTHA